MSEQRTFTLEEIEQQTGFDKRTIAYYVQQGLLPKVGRRGPKTRYPQLFMDRLEFVRMIRKKQDLGEVGNLTLADIRDILTKVSSETIAGVVAGERPLRLVNDLGGLKPLSAEIPPADPTPIEAQKPVRPSALTEEAAEISEGLMDVAEDKKPAVSDLNRRVRLGLMDANAAAVPGSTTAPGRSVQGAAPATPIRSNSTPLNDGESVRPARRFEDEIKKNHQPPPQTKADPPGEVPEESPTPPSIEIERLGWFLARLQRAMTGDRRRRTGTTESWHRAMVTPELTISARNLKDDDAYLLDAVARILKKLLWEAWEE
jgi:DNA-binding transcriptional MerR regulator